MRSLLVLLLLLPLVGCHSIIRLFRNSPLTGVEADPQRVNLWPLFYASGGSLAVLWPVFDDDEDGFALRPLITRDGTNWELLPPLCWWNTATGNWVFLPAYSIDEQFGLFPLFGSGSLNHVGPVWWGEDAAGKLDGGGLFPVVKLGDGLNYVGPAWWQTTAGGSGEADQTSFGLFPLFDFGDGFRNIGPVVWGYRPDGDMQFMVAFPLFGVGTDEDGSGMILSALGGRGWDENGDTSFVNVLGPVFHYDRLKDGYSLGVLWPLFFKSEAPHYAGWQLWPFVGSGTYLDSAGAVRLIETTALAGLFRIGSTETSTHSVRLLPLFGYRSKDGGSEDLLDYLSLYGHKEYESGEVGIHVGTPLLFNYRGGKDGYRWNSLLGMIQYESAGEDSEFRLLYYLYRQKTRGTETQRDFFPFISWDSGEKRSSFSFLWRLFHWERNGDEVGGHILFIPWGDG